MKKLTLLFFWGYVAMLIGVGGSGIFIAEWELHHIFHIDLQALAEEPRASILNQYRFLKGIELGFGLFCVTFRKEIFEAVRFHRLFLIMLFIGVAARTLSIVIDSVPHWAFIGFTIGEFITGALVFVYARQTLTKP